MFNASVCLFETKIWSTFRCVLLEFKGVRGADVQQKNKTTKFGPTFFVLYLYWFVATFVAGFSNTIRSHTTANVAVTQVEEWRTKMASTCAFLFCALLITTQLEKVTI